MTTCRCCGQTVKVEAANPAKPVRPAEPGRFSHAGRAGEGAGAIDAVWVDAGLMACCNAAFEAARTRGAAQVEIAHFLFAGTRMDAARVWFASVGLCPERLAGELLGEMRRRDEAAPTARSGGGGIATSSQLQALIYRAREDGLRRGLSSIAIADVLGVLVAQADALGMRDRLSAWFAASAGTRGLDAGAGVAGGANGGARGAQWRETGAQFARVPPSKRDGDRGRADDAWRQRECSNVRLDHGRASHLDNEAAQNATRNVVTDVARDAAGGGYVRSQEPPTSRAPAPVPQGDQQLLMRMEAQLAEQDRALRALSQQLARFEAAARAETMSRHAGGLAGGLAHGGATGRTQRGYRASSSRWRQRRRAGVGGRANRIETVGDIGGDFGRRLGRGAGAGRSDGSRDGLGDWPRRSGSDGPGGGSGRGSGASSNGGDGRRAADGAGHGASRESGGGRGFGAGEGRGSGGGVGSGSGMGAGHGSGTGSGTGSGKASGGRKSRGRTASAHGPRDRYSRMRQLRQRLSSRRNSRSSPEHEHEHNFERDARLPRERGPRDPREGRETSVSSHEASHGASHGTSWARAPWPERSPRQQAPRVPAEPDEPRDETADDDDGDAREKRFYLALDDDVVAAPSIGPRTAGRLIPNGIVTVRDLLACDADALAAQVTARHITAERIRAWQAQARLVCTIPWLRGTHAQLLVGAGYQSADEILADTPDGVCAAILAFAATREGQSVLRSGEPPQMERLLKWVEHAGLSEPERAELAA